MGGWSGNNCNIRTCEIDCGPNGECEESDESLFSARSGVMSSFFVRQNQKVSSNCGTTGKFDQVQCLRDTRLRHYGQLPVWCTVAKCPENLPKLCRNGQCKVDCTWAQEEFKKTMNYSISLNDC